MPLASNPIVNVRATAGTSLALALAVTGAAHAERAIRVSGAADSPFAPDELVAALRVRIPDRGPAVEVRVTAVAADRVTVAIGDHEQAVEVGTRRGADAARLVALAIADTADDVGPDYPTSAPGTIGAVDRTDPAMASAEHGWELEVGGAGTARVWNSILAGATGEIAVIHGSWLGAVELAGDRTVSGALSLSGVAVRAEGGVRSGAFELRAGAIVAPTQEHDGLGDSTILAGATGSIRVRGSIAHAVAIVFAAGLDAYATQTTYVLGNRTYQTPWVAPWIGLGTEVAL